MDNRIADGVLRAVGLWNGVRPYDWLERLETMQWWDADRMGAWQRAEFGRVVTHAAVNVPHYRDAIPTTVTKAPRTTSRAPKATSPPKVSARVEASRNFTTA